MPRRCHPSSTSSATSVSSPSHNRWPSPTSRPEAVCTARVRPKRGLSRWLRYRSASPTGPWYRIPSVRAEQRSCIAFAAGTSRVSARRTVMSLPSGSVSTSRPRGTRGPSRASSSTSARARANSAGVNGRWGRSTLITPPSGARSRSTVSSSAPSGGTAAAARAPAPSSAGAGRDLMVQRPSNWRSANGSSAASRAVRAARPSTRVGASTRSWASARSVQVRAPPAVVTTSASSAALSSPGARSRNSSTVPSVSGCVCRLRMSIRRSARAAQSTASDPGASRTVVRIRHSALSPPAPDPHGSLPPGSLPAGPVPAGRSAVGGRAPVSSAGGACPWRRDHRVWKPAVAISAASEASTRAGTVGPWSTRRATASVTSDMSRLMHPL